MHSTSCHYIGDRRNRCFDKMMHEGISKRICSRASFYVFVKHLKKCILVKLSTKSALKLKKN